MQLPTDESRTSDRGVRPAICRWISGPGRIYQDVIVGHELCIGPIEFSAPKRSGLGTTELVERRYTPSLPSST